MLTDTVRHPTDPVKFLLCGGAGSLLLFGLFRLRWVETHALLPFTRAQGAVAFGLFGEPTAPVETTLACSGTDAIALCLAAVFAYPARWRTRVAGAACGTALILALNTVRIGTLGQAAASPAWFNVLHVYLWPGLLTLAIAAFTLAWMRLADGQRTLGRTLLPDVSADAAPPAAVAWGVGAVPQSVRRFVLLTLAFVLIFVAGSSLYLDSAAVLALAGVITRAAAAILGAGGLEVQAAANVLVTPRGGFLVTQECISTPLIPVYLAAVCAYSATWPRLTVALLCTVPLFIALAVMRVLLVALPDALSPIFLVHAFYQLLLAAVIVTAAAVWRHGPRAGPGRALAGILAGLAFAYVFGAVYTRVVAYPAGAALDDPQGAVALLPAFQIGLYLALSAAAHGMSARRMVGGLALLALTQTAGLLTLQVLATHAGVTAHVRDIRVWAVAVPVLIFAAATHVPARR